METARGPHEAKEGCRRSLALSERRLPKKLRAQLLEVSGERLVVDVAERTVGKLGMLREEASDHFGRRQWLGAGVRLAGWHRDACELIFRCFETAAAAVAGDLELVGRDVEKGAGAGVGSVDGERQRRGRKGHQ